jgi:translocation and assembly module TamB
MSQSPPPQNPFSARLNRLLRFARKPSTIAIATTSVTLIIISYTGLRLFLREYLPPLLEEQVSQLINRPVEIGELKGFSLTSLHLEGASIPATSEHSNQLTAKTIMVKFNPLAVLFQRTLPIVISPQEVQVTIREDRPRNWLNLTVGEKPFPIDFDVTFDVKKTEVMLWPHRTKKPVAVKLEGTVRYQEKGEQKLNYAINLGFFDSDEIKLEGETFIGTTESNIQLTLNKLALQPLASLLPNFPLSLEEGNLNADFNLSLPSLLDLRGTQGKGSLELGGFQVEVKPLKEPINAGFKIGFEKEKIFINQGDIKIGNIVTNIEGYYDWKRGSNLKVAVQNLSIENLLKVIPVTSPLKTKGKFDLDFKITGMLDNPLIKGKVVNNKLIQVSETYIKTIFAEFQISLDEFLLKNVLIEPQAGGQIKVQGNINQNLTQLIKNKKKIDIKQFPFELIFQANLPSKRLINTYYSLPTALNLDSFTAEGKLTGTFANINGLIKWKNSANLSQPNTTINSQGDILINQTNLLLRDTAIQTQQGIINITGSGSFKTKQWQTYIDSNSLNLTSFFTIICVEFAIKCPQNIQLNRANIRVSGKIDQPFLQSLNVNSNLLLSVNEGNIIINNDIRNSIFQTDITTLNLPVNSFLSNLPVTVSVNNSRLSLSGNLEDILSNENINLNAIKGKGNIELNIGESLVTAKGEIEGESLKAVAKINGLSVNKIIPKISVPVELINSEINLQGNLRSLLFSQIKSKFNELQITANTDILIANQSVTAKTQLNQGVVKGNVTTTPLSMAPFIIEGYPIINIRKSEIDFTASLSSLLSFDFSDINGYSTTELDIGEGILTVNGKVSNNQVIADINTQNIELSSLNADLFDAFPSDKLNTQINASFPLSSILPSQTIIPFNINTFSLQVGEQKIKANGEFIVSNLWTSPDIKSLSIEVDTDFDLSVLPLTQLLTKIPIDRQLLPETLELIGEGNFTGKLIGKNLLTAPFYPGNLEIIGDINIANLTFNEQEFEPNLTGKISIDFLDKISINIGGKKDRISAVINPCLLKKCPLVSFIESFEIRQTYNNNLPIIATVKRENDNLFAKVESFPIDILKITPLGNYGLPDYLSGLINIDISFNQSELNTIGKLTISYPSFGKVSANQFETLLVYENGQISLDKTQLIIGESNYNIVGSLDVKTGNINGNLDIKKGKIEDILIALKISNWDSLLRFLQIKKTDFNTAEEMMTNKLAITPKSIAEKLYELWISEEKIKERFAKVQAGDLPRELDFTGQYQAQIALSGNLKKPELSLDFQGNKWRWNTQPSTASIIRELGVVMEGSQVIPIEKININGQLKDGIVALNPNVKIGTATAAGSLNLFYKNANIYLDSSEFKVSNFDIDLVRNLIVVPNDINGIINANGTLNGALDAPKIDGLFEFNDGAINGRLLNQDFAGKFNYSDDKLKVETTKPEFIKASLTLPFPIIENSNEDFEIKANLEQESFAFLQPLTLDKIIWVNGEGNVFIDIKGKVFIDNQFKISLDSDSEISLNLNNAVFTNNLIPTFVTVNGQAKLKNRSLNIEQLTADIGKSRLNISGILPLIPVNSNLDIINNFLNINIVQNEINKSGIYQGLINGNVMIAGALISPIISGNINFTEGTIKIPNFNLNPKETSNTFEQWLGTFSPKDSIFIPPQLENLKISLETIEIVNQATLTLPEVLLDVSGDITLNGKINSLSLAELLTIKPSGKIKINSGKVNIPVTRVFISDQNENTLTFLPNQGLLNPSIDLELKLYIFAVALLSIEDNEITDDIVQSGRAKSAEITLNIQGSASEVLPSLGKSVDELCQFNDDNNPPISSYNKTSPENLEKLAQCIEINNLGVNSIADLLRSPIVSVSSNPPLSNTELLTLFGQQLPALLEQLQRQNSTQLLEAGVVQSAVVVLPFLQDWVFNSNKQTSEFGESLGLTNLRLFPVLETVYKLEDNAVIRFSYDYTLNEATIRYENKF